MRWRIQQLGEVPFGIAGIWEKWIDTESGSEMFSFAMLTVNADGHPVMSRFHKWGEEKRMPIFLDPHEYDDWLTCPVNEAQKFFPQWLGQVESFPAPLAPRAKKVKPAVGQDPVDAKPPPPSPSQRDLF